MNRLINNSLAAVVAAVIALTSLSAVTSVPMQHGVVISAPTLA